MIGKGLATRLGSVRNGLGRAGLAAAALLAAAVIAAGCEVPLQSRESAPPSFAHVPPLVFDLERIEVVERGSAPHPSDVDHLFPIPPAVAARLWVEDRLRASGSVGVLRVTIEEASARATPLATNKNLEGLLTEEQAERIDCGCASPSRRSTGAARSTAAPPPRPNAPARCRRALLLQSASGTTTRWSGRCSRLQHEPGGRDPEVLAALPALTAGGAVPASSPTPPPPPRAPRRPHRLPPRRHRGADRAQAMAAHGADQHALCP